MSSVERSVDCPQCGYPDAREEFQMRNYTTQTLCLRCGFYCKEMPDRPDFIEEGHGAYSIYEDRRGGVCGCLPSDPRQRAQMIEEITADAEANTAWIVNLFLAEGRKVIPLIYSQRSKDWDKEIGWDICSQEAK
jgi:hypothetical protein